ncbi:MAG: carbohydrate ABC transporter permease [Bacteroidota bacterium]
MLAWAFLAPAVLSFALFSWYPIIKGLVVSVQRFHPIKPPVYVGLENFRLLLEDPNVPTAWLNTFCFVGLALLIGYLVPVALAVTINETRRLQPYLRVAYYLPSILPAVVVSFMWRWFYDPSGSGLFNAARAIFGLPPSVWLLDRRLSLLCLVIMATWAGAGATCMIYLAALQGIPSELYEAAEIDGASILKRLRHVTLPQLRPVMLTFLILQVIGTVQVITEPMIMTQGGPNNATLTVMLLIYRYAFQFYDFGMAAALGLVLFAVLVLISALYFKVARPFAAD